MATIVWGNERAIVEFCHQLEKTRLCLGRRLAERYTERPALVSAASHQCFLTLVNVDADPIAGGVRVLAEQGRLNHSARIGFGGLAVCIARSRSARHACRPKRQH